MMNRLWLVALKRPLLAVLLALLSACAGPPPGPPQSRPASGQPAPPPAVAGPAAGAGVQVFPLQNPAVKELLASARQSESGRRYDQAATALERALRIEPRDPEILQQMAEVQWQKEDYQQALNFAIRSYDSGPRVGEICARNWHTIALARARLGDNPGAADARRRAGECVSAKPDGY